MEKEISVWMDSETHKKLKLAAKANRTSMSKILANMAAERIKELAYQRPIEGPKSPEWIQESIKIMAIHYKTKRNILPRDYRDIREELTRLYNAQKGNGRCERMPWYFGYYFTRKLLTS